MSEYKKLIGMFGANGSVTHLDKSTKSMLLVKLGNYLGLNQYVQPFRIYRDVNGDEFLYATKECCAELRHINGISVTDIQTSFEGELVYVKATGINNKGRLSTEIGSVNIAVLDGQDKANGVMWATTKAKRRLTLDLSGLGVLADVEVKDMTQVIEYNVMEEAPKMLKGEQLVAMTTTMDKIKVPVKNKK